jgi:hypothetical protein
MTEGQRAWRSTLPWVLQVVSFNEALAVPIALMTVSTGVPWTTSLIGASAYTQFIGSLCFTAGALMEGRCLTLAMPWRIAL